MSPGCPLARAVQQRLDSTALDDLRQLIDPAVRHALRRGCDDCRAVLSSLERGVEEPVAAAERPWPAEALGAERARRIAAKLIEMPASRRRMYLFQSRAACARPVVEALIAAAKSRLSTDSERAVEIAELAVFCADNIEPDRYPEEVWSDLLAVALTALAGARRRAGDFAAAADALGEAEAAARLGSGRASVAIDLAEKRGWLAIDQRLYERALESFTEGAEIAAAGSDRHLHGRCLYNRAAALEWLERYREALADLHVAALCLDVEREPRLGFATLLALANCSEGVGNLDGALDYLDRAEREWGGLMNPADRVRVAWNRGRIWAASGELARARRHYARARAGFVELGHPLDAALVTLELAATLAELGEFPAVAELAEEMLGVFRAKAVDPEAVAACYLLREARSLAAVERAAAAITRHRKTVRSPRRRR